MPLKIKQPEPEPPEMPKRETDEERLARGVKKRHKDNVSWLESNGFEQSFVEGANEGRYGMANVAYKMPANYGNVYILLYRDGMTSGSLDAEGAFSAENEINDFETTYKNKLSKAVEVFNNKISDIEEKMEGKNKDMGKRIDAVVPEGISVDSPITYKIKDSDDNGIGRRGIDYGFSASIGCYIQFGKSKKTAEEVYKVIEETVEALEGKF